MLERYLIHKKEFNTNKSVENEKGDFKDYQSYIMQF